MRTFFSQLNHDREHTMLAPTPSTGYASPSVTLTSPTSTVYLEYDAAALPPTPEGWTRFVCISDTHARTFPVPPGDVLLHSGDLTRTGSRADFATTMTWLAELPHTVKIVIAGNHDLPLHEGWYDVNYSRWHAHKEAHEPIMELLKGPAAVKAGIVYLQDETHEFQVKEGRRKWSVFGSPWSPEFYNWAFNYERGEEAHDIVSQYPKTDILLTHGPPHSLFDLTNTHVNAGCEALAERLPELRPRLHLFGHIHEARGARVCAWSSSLMAGAAQNLSANSDDRNDADGFAILGTLTQEQAASPEDDGELERTVFVNAANWPAGTRTWRNGTRVPFGTGPFAPIVVDLKD